MGKSLDIIKAPKQKPITPNTLGNNDREKDKDKFFDTPRREEHSDPLLFYLVLGLCAIILLVALSVWLIYKSFNQSSSKSDETKTESTTSTTSDSAAVTDKSTTEEKTTPTETTKETTDSSVNKAEVKIRIVNGNGRNGEAALMKTALEDDGFKNITTGNAASRYSTTLIYYNTGKIAEAKAVEKIISAKYKTSLMEDPNITKSNDVVVALGEK